MMRPKPRHFGQAPNGELKEKRAAVGLRRVKPVLGLVQVVEKVRDGARYSVNGLERDAPATLAKLLEKRQLKSFSDCQIVTSDSYCALHPQGWLC